MAGKKTTSADVFSDEEKAAMQESAAERKRERGRTGTPAEKAAAAAQEVLDKIAELGDADRVIAERVHEIVRAAAPELAPKTWYGMPAYYQDGKLICFFQPAAKFKARYSTLGFDANAALDDGHMWPTSWALTEITPEVEAQIAALVRRAIG